MNNLCSVFQKVTQQNKKSLKIKWNSVQNPATAMSEGRSMTIGTGKLLYGTCHDLNTVNSLIATTFRKQPPDLPLATSLKINVLFLCQMVFQISLVREQYLNLLATAASFQSF